MREPHLGFPPGHRVRRRAEAWNEQSDAKAMRLDPSRRPAIRSTFYLDEHATSYRGRESRTKSRDLRCDLRRRVVPRQRARRQTIPGCRWSDRMDRPRSSELRRWDYWISEPATTNNRMALRSVIEAFSALQQTEQVFSCCLHERSEIHRRRNEPLGARMDCAGLATQRRSDRES